MLAFLVGAVVLSLILGHREHAQPAVGGKYSSTSACLSKFTLQQSGTFVDASGPGSTGGKLRLEHHRLKGHVTCSGGEGAALDVPVPTSEPKTLSGTLNGQAFQATFTEALPPPGASAKKPPKRSGEETFGRLMLAIAAVILAARLVGTALGKIGQPRVMGEVLAGILLGPTLLGAVWPAAKDYLFPADIVPLLSGAAQIGLAFYLFLVGMELDPRLLRVNAARAAFVSNTSVAFPMALGMLVAAPIYRLLAPHKDYLPFALFMGVSMSITAFPVLARILVEKRMLKRPVGALAMASAAIDDVTAWTLLAFATAVASASSSLGWLKVVGLAAAFTIGLVVVVRPLLARIAVAYDEVGYVPQLWIGTIFVGVLLAAYVSRQIGIAAIFGAFVMGLIMPRHAGLTSDVSRRLEDFVTMVLLPLFFVVTGLKTQIGSLNRPILWLLCVLLIGVAVAGKWFGAMFAARWGGMRLRDSAAFGALMNTRGLTELIVLNIGLDLGLISHALFTMLVVMALVTTFMAGPALRLLDPKEELSAPPEEEFRRARLEGPVPETIVPQRSIIVAPQDDTSVDALIALGEPLARSQPARELILVRLVHGRAERASRAPLGARRARPRSRVHVTRPGLRSRPPLDRAGRRPRDPERTTSADRRRRATGRCRHRAREGAVRCRRACRARRDSDDRRGSSGVCPVRRRRARLGGPGACSMDRVGARSAAEAPRRLARRGRERRRRRRARREPADRQRLARRSAAGRNRCRARAGRAGPTADQRGIACRSARDRTL